MPYGYQKKKQLTNFKKQTANFHFRILFLY